MKVKELIKILELLNPEDEVYIAQEYNSSGGIRKLDVIKKPADEKNIVILDQ